MTLTAKEVAEITRLLEESGFDELYLEMEGLKLTLRRGGTANGQAGGPPGIAGPTPQPDTAVPTRQPDAAVPTRQPDAAAPAPRAPSVPTPTPAATDPTAQDIRAPLLGTFYRSPKPGALPFVEVGSQVEEDTIICIIEVMKLMNTVRAGVRGRVTEILARDGVLVEYDDTLMRVDKSNHS